MSHFRYATLALLTVLVSSCGLIQSEPAVSIDPGGPDLGARWNANLSTPRQLSGAVSIRGEAWMAPVAGGDVTQVSVGIENAAPGGVHPWQVHRGRCGSNQGMVGSTDDYEPLEVGSEGRASSSTSLEFIPNDDRTYFIAVYASPTNRDQMVACGNLAPPSD